MIRITALYPRTPGGHFDMDYFLDEHLPMVLERFGKACKGSSVDEVVAGIAPPGPAVYQVMVQYLFESTEEFLAAFNPHAEAIGEDVANYTNLHPIIQVSEIRA
jgi:uncharacterized protein (TIGR02118 family)